MLLLLHCVCVCYNGQPCKEYLPSSHYCVKAAALPSRRSRTIFRGLRLCTKCTDNRRRTYIVRCGAIWHRRAVFSGYGRRRSDIVDVFVSSLPINVLTNSDGLGERSQFGGIGSSCIGMTSDEALRGVKLPPNKFKVVLLPCCLHRYQDTYWRYYPYTSWTVA